MIEIIGYIALVLALFAMMSKRLITLRIIHLVSCLFYAVYGLFKGANPVLIGAILFGGIHIYYLYKMTNIKINKRNNHE